MNLDQKLAGVILKFAGVIGLLTLAVIVLLATDVLLEIKLPALSPALVKPPATAPVATTPATTTPEETAETPLADQQLWRPPDLAALPATPENDRIRYGRQLIAHTARYLGPQGSVRQFTNGMNCQNCHLDAGTKAFGNNYALVAATYPKFRARSGTEEDVVKRVHDCLERSLNGQPLPVDNREMQALVAYINWVGHQVKKDEKPKGSGLVELPLLARAANPEKGKAVYAQKCQSCHGPGGQGIRQPEGKEYLYPPLWGKSSYNDGAGLYRISNFARYVKANMPLGASYDQPQLTDEQAWDVAAYVNSMPRPKKNLSQDWPDIAKKPFDHPFGPYADAFSEKQHKYGPYQPILAADQGMKP
jgi:thiosulfate dehydrogenase